MNLIELYQSILDVAKLTTDEDGYVSNELMGNKEPFIINGKRLVLPTSIQLRNPDRESRIVFHPLRENALQTGESEILSTFRNALNTRLNASVALLIANLVRIGTSIAEHKKLNPDQMEYLVILKNADEKTFDTLAKIIAEMPLGQTKKAFVSIYLKKGAKLADRTYKRGGIVSFPFYNDLLEAKDEIYGVKIRQKDKVALKALLEYIFGNEIATVNHYSFGSSSDVAPSLESVMGAIKNIGTIINDKVEMFKDILEDTEEMIIPADWVESFDNIEKYLPEIRMIPTQFGNDGIKPTVTENTTSTNEVKGIIPVKEKLSFAALPNNNPQPVQNNNTGLGLVSQGGIGTIKTMSLSDAFRGNQNNLGNSGIGMMGVNQTPVIGVRTNPFVGNNNSNYGFASLPNNNMMGTNNPFVSGFGGTRL